MAQHVIEANPTMVVSINGRDYRMEVGNLTAVLEIGEWQRAISSLDSGSGVDAFRDLAERGRAIAAAAFGEKAADELLGGGDRLNIVRVVRLLSVIAEEMSSDESVAATLAALGEFADTADED